MADDFDRKTWMMFSLDLSARGSVVAWGLEGVRLEDCLDLSDAFSAAVHSPQPHPDMSVDPQEFVSLFMFESGPRQREEGLMRQECKHALRPGRALDPLWIRDRMHTALGQLAARHGLHLHGPIGPMEARSNDQIESGALAAILAGHEALELARQTPKSPAARRLPGL